jgi:hypothetical protein
MTGFAIHFIPPTDISGNTQRFGDDSIVITYDKFYEHYKITSAFHNSATKHMSLNKFDEVVSFLHSLYKYVNMDMVNKSTDYIAFVQVDAGMFPSIQFSRRELLKAEFVADLDEAFATWATVMVPGIQRMVDASAPHSTQTASTPNISQSALESLLSAIMNNNA